MAGAAAGAAGTARPRRERIAPFGGYFLDPLAATLVRLGLPAWVAALLLLIADAAALVAVARAG